jgi:aryl-alcohol dehydrogenase-like predicted oxidoreductase
MKYRTHKDLTLSEIGVGCYALSGVYGPKDPNRFKAMLVRAYELGINFFDVAEGYGNAELILGGIVRTFRTNIHIASKVGVIEGLQPNLSRAYIEKACERSLTRLQTDYLDLYQVHFDDPETPVEETVQALEDLKQAGKIRHYGVCHLPIERVTEYMRLGDPFSVLMELSAVTRDALNAILPLCQQHQVAGIAFSTTGRGILTGHFDQNTIFPADDLRSLDPLFQRERLLSGLRVANELERLGQKYGKTPAQMAIAWVLAQPGIFCALTGASTREHLEENLAAIEFEFSDSDLTDFRVFLNQEAVKLAHEQREAICSIFNSPASAITFADLLYVIDNAVQLEVLSENEGMSLVQELFALRDMPNEIAQQKMEALKNHLVDVFNEYFRG